MRLALCDVHHRVDAEIRERAAAVDRRAEADGVWTDVARRAEMRDEPADLAGTDVLRRLHGDDGAVVEDERGLRAVHTAIPTGRAGVAQRERPLDRAVRRRARIRRLRLERRAVRA